MDKSTRRVRPSHDIDPRDKSSEKWLVSNARYYYDRYINDECTVSASDRDRFEVLRSYMDGCQDTSKYKPMLKADKSPNGDGWLNINWENVYNPMPKTVRKVQGMFLSEDHSIVASAVSEKARTEKLKNAYRDFYKKKYKPKVEMMEKITGAEAPKSATDMGFSAESMDEASMIAGFSSEKLNYELASEKIVEYTMKLSEYSRNKEKSVYDLIRGNMMVNRDYVDDYTGKVEWDYVDISRFAGDFEQDTKSMTWGGVFEFYTIEEIRKYRPDISEDELRMMAKNNMKISRPKAADFSIYNKYYSSDRCYGYDDFLIPVFSIAFKSLDSKYKKKVKIKSGEFRMYDADFGKTGKNISKETTETIYETSWIIDTDYMLYGGMMTDIPRDSSGKVRMPYHVVKIDGKSICELSIEKLDQLALLGYKLQNAWAKAIPNSYGYDFSALEDIADASGQKLDPFDLIKMFQQGQGIPFRGAPMDEADIVTRRDVPVTPILGGIGSFLNEVIVTKDMLIKDLAEITGISPFEMPNSSGGTATEAKLAVASMSDVLKPLYSSYIRIKEELAYNTIVRCQILFKFNKKARKAYEDAIGKVHVDNLASAMSSDPMDIGVKFEALPTMEQKQAVLQAAQAALKVGRNGKSILKMSEYMFIFRHINTQSGLKEAEMLLSFREAEDEKKEFAMQQAAIESQQQGMMQQQQMKIQGEVAKKQAQGQIDMGLNKQESDLSIREHKAKKQIDSGYDTFNKGMEIGMEQQNTQ